VGGEQADLVQLAVAGLGGLTRRDLRAQRDVAEVALGRLLAVAAGSSSSIGNARTSVGALLSIHCPLRASMVPSSTRRSVISVPGCRRIRSITNRDSRVRSATSTWTPDSLRTSTVNSASQAPERRGPDEARRLDLGVVLVVGRDDPAH
jgi:hypothetical protein